jgi:hypothetical protein
VIPGLLDEKQRLLDHIDKLEANLAQNTTDKENAVKAKLGEIAEIKRLLREREEDL